MAMKGSIWNESTVYQDAITLRNVRKITNYGQYNYTPGYHTNISFTQDGKYLIFNTGRLGTSAVCKCEVETGDITCLIEPIAGVGPRNELEEINRSYLGNGKGVSNVRLDPTGNIVVYTVECSLRSVDINTLEEKILIEDIGYENNFVGACSTIDKQGNLIYATCSAHPQLIKGEFITKSYHSLMCDNIKVKYYRMPITGGKPELIYEPKDGLATSHPQICPNDDDLLLINRERGHEGPQPDFTRTWTYRISTGELNPINSNDKRKFHIHTTWAWDGESILYHGPSHNGGWYVGISSKTGEIIKEFCFKDSDYYGHVGADPNRKAIVLDGNLTNDLIVWLYYDGDMPRVEIIAKHDTDYLTMPGQYGHPHPAFDPTGRWMAFNASKRTAVLKDDARRARSDIYIVEI
jgi:hypothetical protein